MPDPSANPTAAEDTSTDLAWRAAQAWARSGVVALCGDPGGPPLLPPLHAATRIAGLAEEVSTLAAARGHALRIRWDAALAGRAALLGLARRGRTSANGSCRLIRAADAEVALNLPRPDDVSLVPALTSDPDCGGRPWEAAAAMAASMPAADFVERARMLGLAASVAFERSWPPQPSGDFSDLPYASRVRGAPGRPSPDGRLTVVDLSSLWAGPVTARVLAEAGAEVIKVEDTGRPDSARMRPEFYDWVHKERETTVRLDFASPGGRARLGELLRGADVVIESSRPRALEQISLGPGQLEPAPGQVWLSITGHGRGGPARDWVGFGDDAAVAGGLVCTYPNGALAFCGDAIADPVAGLAGAAAVLRSLGGGGGQLLEVSLSGAAAWAAAGSGQPPDPQFVVEASDGGWVVRRGGLSERVAAAPPTLEWIAKAGQRD